MWFVPNHQPDIYCIYIYIYNIPFITSQSTSQGTNVSCGLLHQGRQRPVDSRRYCPSGPPWSSGTRLAPIASWPTGERDGKEMGITWDNWSELWTWKTSGKLGPCTIMAGIANMIEQFVNRASRGFWHARWTIVEPSFWTSKQFPIPLHSALRNSSHEQIVDLKRRSKCFFVEVNVCERHLNINRISLGSRVVLHTSGVNLA